MPPTLSPETQAAITQALSDKAVADQADADETEAANELAMAAKTHENSLQEVADAHRQSADSAHAALASLAKDFGVSLTTS